MKENWLEAIVYFKNPSIWENKRRVALRFIKPTLEELWYQKEIMFFYYFFKPELHLRLCSEKDNFEKIKAVVKRRLKSIQDYLLRPVEFAKHRGEFEISFKNTGSEEAWYVVRDFLMENSGTALHFLEILDKETIFDPTNWMFNRFLHSFCNELGFSDLEEGKILFEYSVFRAVMEACKKRDKKEARKILDELNWKLQSLTAEILQQI